jgi:L-fucose mutarotase
MLKGQLIHPQILAALGKAGHSSKVLISDGHYPHATERGANSEMVYLNLSPDVVTCTDVLRALVTAIAIERAEVMEPMSEGPYAMKNEPAIWGEYRKIFSAAGVKAELEAVERFAFYERAKAPEVCLIIATGDRRSYANLLVTIGTEIA